MSSLLYALGKLCYRRWKAVFAIWLAVLVVIGGGVLGLSKGAKDVFFIPGAEAFEAFDELKHRFPEIAGANGQVLVIAEHGKVTDPANRKAIVDFARSMQTEVPQTVMILDPWNELVEIKDPSTGKKAKLLDEKDTVSADQTAAIINVQMAVSVEQVLPSTQDKLVELSEKASTENLSFHPGGGAWGPEPPKIGISEGIGVVVALIVLFLTFRTGWRWRSLRPAGIAAALPLISAGAGLGISMGIILILTKWLVVTTTAPFLALMTGLAVGIDYSLFVLARHRDEMEKGVDAEESTGRALATAGSAVIFAGVTVIIALLGLVVTQIPFLTIMGVAGAIAVLTAVVASLTLLPAMFGLLKESIAPAPAPQPRKPSKKPAKTKKTVGERYVSFVTKVPILTIAAVGALLVFLSLPALDLRLALPDNGTAHHGSTQREVYEEIGERFGPGYNSQIVVQADIVQSLDPVKLIEDVKKEILKLDNIHSLPIATPNPPDGDTMIIQVTPKTGPNDEETVKLVHDLRDLEPMIQEKYGIDINVTGMTGASVDISEQLGKAVVPFGILVIGLSLVLLAIVFRSIAVPIKATLTYLLSVAASFGVVTAVFQKGFLAEQLNVVYVGPIICFLPILLMGLLFGLAMDYEVFLVSRMREEYVHGTPAKKAVHGGFVSSFKVVMAAALIMIAVFAAFEPHGDAVTQPIAFALAVGVFVDAFLVRMTLVPAILAMLGNWAWWMPKWMDKSLPVLDVEGEGVNHQLDLANWPSADAHLGVHADRILLKDSRDKGVYGPVSFEVAPGEVTLVRGLNEQARAALALGLSGRMRISDGKLKIAGYVVPEQMLMLRPFAALVRLGDEELPVDAVREAVTDRTKVLVVDGLDLVPSTEDRDMVLAEVRHHAETSGVAALVTLSRETLQGLGVSDPTIRVLDLQTSRVTPLGAPVTEGALA